MKIKRIIAADMREAMRQVRQILGDDAVILSNKTVHDGVEVIAAMDFDEKAIRLAAGQQSATRVAGRKQVARPDPAPVDHDDGVAYTPHSVDRHLQPQAGTAGDQQSPQTTAELLAERARKQAQAEQERAVRAPQSAVPEQTVDTRPVVDEHALQEDRDAFSAALAEMAEEASEPAVRAPESAAAASHKPAAQEHWDWLVEDSDQGQGRIAELTEEVGQLRELFERQLAVMEWHRFSQAHPAEIDTAQKLQGLGVPTGLAQRLAQSAVKAQPERAFSESLRQLGKQIRISRPDPVEAGGVYALVGPTGVGKTTTLAKLAARAVLHRGRDHVALITTDRFRIGAQEQLRNYARILNVPLHVARDEDHLKQLIEAVSDRHLVLIDTAGTSQRDLDMIERLDALVGAGLAVRRLLVLSANAQYPAMEDAKRRFAQLDLHGVVLTKLDETVLLGGALAALVRPFGEDQGDCLPLVCAGVGQRVPEDIWFPNGSDLIKQAIEMGKAQLGQTDRDDPLWMLKQVG